MLNMGVCCGNDVKCSYRAQAPSGVSTENKEPQCYLQCGRQIGYTDNQCRYVNNKNMQK